MEEHVIELIELRDEASVVGCFGDDADRGNEPIAPADVDGHLEQLNDDVPV